MHVKSQDKKNRGRPSLEKQFDFDKVLDIAIQSFANKGFDGAQMKAIADEAGYAKSLMNYHFGNKDNLWKEAVIHLSKKLEKRLLEAQNYFKDLEGLTAMKAYTRQFVFFSAKYPEFYKIVFHEMNTRTERANWLVEVVLKPLHEIFERNTDNPKAENLTIGGLPIANVVSIVIGAANVFFIHAFQMEKMYKVKTLDEEEIEKHADIVIETLFKGLENNE